VRAGTLLVSSTELVEPTFRRSVVYIIEHNEAGSLGRRTQPPSDTACRTSCRAGPRWRRPAHPFIGAR